MLTRLLKDESRRRAAAGAVAEGGERDAADAAPLAAGRKTRPSAVAAVDAPADPLAEARLTIMPPSPVPLELPRKPRRSPDTQHVAGASTSTFRPARAIRCEDSEGLLVHLPGRAYLAGRFADFARMGIPPTFFQLLTDEFFPLLEAHAEQIVSAEQLADLIVFAIYSFNEGESASTYAVMNEMASDIFDVMLPADCPALRWAARRRFRAAQLT